MRIGCFGWFLIAATLFVSFLTFYFVVTSDLPDWAKFLLLW